MWVCRYFAGTSRTAGAGGGGSETLETLGRTPALGKNFSISEMAMGGKKRALALFGGLLPFLREPGRTGAERSGTETGSISPQP